MSGKSRLLLAITGWLLVVSVTVGLVVSICSTDNFYWYPNTDNSQFREIGQACTFLLSVLLPFYVVIVSLLYFGLLSLFSGSRMTKVRGLRLIAVGILSLLIGGKIVDGALVDQWMIIFDHSGTAECSRLLPIAFAGSAAGPVLLERIRENPNGDSGWYVLGLGVIGYEPAVPFLDSLLRTGSVFAATRAMRTIDDGDCAERLSRFVDSVRLVGDSAMLKDLECADAIKVGDC